MRKFLLPIINLINLILISITWGLSGKSAILETVNHQSTGRGNIYQVVWMGTHANVLGIIGFFLFCVACLAMLVAFLPIKSRKFVSCAGGLMFVGAGVLMLIAPFPPHYDCAINAPKLSGSLIAMAVLTLIAGAFMLLMSVIDFASEGKKNEKNEKGSLKERFQEELKAEKHGLFYVLGSILSFICSILVIILVAIKFRPVLIYVYLGITLVFVVVILVLEILKGKEKKQQKAAK